MTRISAQAYPERDAALALFSSLIENMQDGVLVETGERRIFAVNTAFCRIFGIAAPPAALVGSDCSNAAAASRALLAEPELFPRRIAAIVATRVAVVAEELRFADGRVYERDYVPIVTRDGHFIGHMWRYRDITARNHAHEELRVLAEASGFLASSLDFDATLDSVVRLTVPALADICALDLIGDDGDIHRVKLAAAQPDQLALLEELRRRYPPTWDSPQPTIHVLRTGEPQLLEHIDHAVAAAHTRDSEHLRLIRETGLSSQLAVPLVARGRTLGVLSLCYARSGRRYHRADLVLATELARRIAAAVDNAALYRAAERANRAKSDFLAVMSHELRTPINAVIGYADLWLADLPEPLSPAMRAQVERVARSAQHLRELIDGILTFSRMEAGREELHLQTTAVTDLVDNVVALIEPAVMQHNLIFQVAPVPAPCTLYTDTGKVRQILLNLLSNAVKFTPQGTVSLTTCVLEDGVSFVVRDSGVGISFEDQRRVFEPFWQAEQSNTRRVGGTGLGLSVARNLARLLEGDLTLESAPGEGTTVTLRLPLCYNGDGSRHSG